MVERDEAALVEHVRLAWLGLVAWQTELDRLLHAVEDGAIEPPSTGWVRLLALYGLNATRVSKVARDLMLLERGDAGSAAWSDTVYDELREETGWDI